MKKDKTYKRKEDMSTLGYLIICFEDDGDIIVGIMGREGGDQEPRTLTRVEFCEIVAGRGRSPHTREALKKLAEAIEKDNQENPI